MTKLKLAVLISGRGSNLQALINACAHPAYPAEIAVVISNNPEAGGLAIAAEAGIPAMICDYTYFNNDKTAFEEALASIIDQHQAQLVCLAGFMRILTPVFLNRFPDKVINIHPSLLPAYKGLNTHERVLAAGDKTHGCTVHVVTAGVDAGAIIGQRSISVRPNDTSESLAARVLTEEHILYPEIIAKIATGSVVIKQGHIERPATIRHHDEIKIESSTEITMTDHSHPHAAPYNDATSIAEAQTMWTSFTKAIMIAGGAIALVLVLLAALFV